MKARFLPFVLLFTLTGCDQPLVKEVYLDGKLLLDDFITTEEKGFFLNQFQFFYKEVTTNENNQFVFAANGYIRSYHGIPYSNLVVEMNAFKVYGFEYYDIDELSYVGLTELNFDEQKSIENKFTYNIGGYKEFMIINETSNSLSINNLYFYSND